MSIHNKVVVILGPTASGKTDLSIKLAKKYKGEIISADSRQVYRGLNWGSGKITKKVTLLFPSPSNLMARLFPLIQDKYIRV